MVPHAFGPNNTDSAGVALWLCTVSQCTQWVLHIESISKKMSKKEKKVEI